MCVSKTFFTLCVKVLETLYFAERLWWLPQWSYWSLWSGFLYTVVGNVLSGPGETKVSENMMESLLPGTFVVTCLCGSLELK